MAEAPACEYRENGRRCHDDGVHEARMSGRTVRLCERHGRPEFHPRDLHDRLPARAALEGAGTGDGEEGSHGG